MKKPLIGITAGLSPVIESMTMDHMPLERHRLNDSYVQAVLRAGGIPVILPICEDPERMRAMADRMDGILLSGGDDLDPNLYGKRPTGKLGNVCPRRDSAELVLADYVLHHTSKPLFGICRGVQVLNVALGGTLHIDLPSIGTESHSLNMYPRSMESHLVEVEEDSTLARILGSGGHHWVNSFHHQAVDALGKGLTITARSSPDAVIEAVELPGERFVIGVQWHPEELCNSEDAAKLFRAFIEASAK